MAVGKLLVTSLQRIVTLAPCSRRADVDDWALANSIKSGKLTTHLVNDNLPLQARYRLSCLFQDFAYRSASPRDSENIYSFFPWRCRFGYLET